EGRCCRSRFYSRRVRVAFPRSRPRHSDVLFPSEDPYCSWRKRLQQTTTKLPLRLNRYLLQLSFNTPFFVSWGPNPGHWAQPCGGLCFLFSYSLDARKCIGCRAKLMLPRSCSAPLGVLASASPNVSLLHPRRKKRNRGRRLSWKPDD